MEKFEFDTEFQFEVLRYTVLHPEGYKIIGLYSEDYFTTIEHGILAHILKGYYKEYGKIPSRVVFLEELRRTFEADKNISSSLLESDKDTIKKMVKEMYKGVVKDPEYIMKQTERFAQFVDLKDTIESIDILDFKQYEKFADKVHKAIAPRVSVEDLSKSFLIAGISDRQLARRDTDMVYPTPFRQINALTSAGGYPKGATIVVVDQPKKKKTAFLVNVIRGYLKMGKKVLVIDLENGEEEYMQRLEQSLSTINKSSLISGESDKKVKKILRKYKRLGGEVVVRRLPALTTNAATVKHLIEELRDNFAFAPNVLVTDYMGKMGCLSKKENLSDRIFEAYVEMSNLCLEFGIEAHWTANHVVRSATPRATTCYRGEDIAGAIDIIRHVNVAFGLNRTPEEEENGIQRLEIIENRDGVPHGRAVFHVDMDTQRFTEFSVNEKKEFDKMYSDYEASAPKESAQVDTSRDKMGDL